MTGIEKYGRRLPIVAVAMLALALTQGGCGKRPTGEPGAKLRFKWAFLCRDRSGAQRVLDFSGPASVHSGDAVQVFVQPIENAYVYLFLFDSAKKLELVFPPDPDFYAESARMGGEYFVPARDESMVMDADRGLEMFYLLASSKRMTALERLAREYAAAPQNAELKAQLLEQIKAVRVAHSRLTSPAEKGVPIAGSVVTRGADAAPSGQGILVEADGFYSKTLRLNHE
ncbi:MAG: DUF4384 domain-containing protein [Kiritimatiellae bacterium]|nr:DUF4384 domain-containing protein [Kiritimatiellia bacterium]